MILLVVGLCLGSAMLGWLARWAFWEPRLLREAQFEAYGRGHDDGQVDAERRYGRAH